MVKFLKKKAHTALTVKRKTSVRKLERQAFVKARTTELTKKTSDPLEPLRDKNGNLPYGTWERAALLVRNRQLTHALLLERDGPHNYSKNTAGAKKPVILKKKRYVMGKKEKQYKLTQNIKFYVAVDSLYNSF